MALQEVMKALADPTRREILNLLKAGPRASMEIAQHFAMSPPAVVKHLTVLKDAGLVRCRRDGKNVYYELCASILEEVMLWLKDLREGSV